MDAIQPVRLSDALTSLKPSTSVGPAAGGGFMDAIGKALETVSTQQSEAADLAKKVQLDDPNVSLEESVIAMQKASISFQAVVQVRNKLVQAYHDVMNMSV